jgi:hypothetical protein
MRFPPEGLWPLHVAFAEAEGVERWTRDFGGHRFASELSAKGDRMVERFGPLRFAFDLPSDPEGLEMRLRGWSAFGLPLPLLLAPRIEAREWEQEGRFRFAVSASLPLVGEIVRYTGWLVPLDSPPSLVGEKDRLKGGGGEKRSGQKERAGAFAPAPPPA